MPATAIAARKGSSAQCGAGFLLQDPAVVFVGSVTAEIKQRDRSSISFTYPQLAPGKYDITVQRGSRTSNAKKVTIAPAAAGVTSPQGGPFADTPKYKQTSVQFPVVRPSAVEALKLNCTGCTLNMP